MPSPDKRVTDSRAFQGALERELVVGGVLIGTVVGVGLIYFLWGQAAAVTALACFGLFVGLIVLIWLFLVGVSWLGNH